MGIEFYLEGKYKVVEPSDVKVEEEKDDILSEQQAEIDNKVIVDGEKALTPEQKAENAKINLMKTLKKKNG